MPILIVESPGKKKTLMSILGAGWQVLASMGHITELAQDGADNLGFDLIEDRVTCRYVPRAERGAAVIAQLRAAVKGDPQVYLASDPDREGEAIAWHLAQVLKLKNPQRVVYSAITREAVQAALKSPRTLNLPLAEAQRARECLDKLVGYRGSSVLRRLVPGAKSAGRVQSATLHLLCKREREIRAFVPLDYWSVYVDYTLDGGGVLRAYYRQGVSPKAAIASGQQSETGPLEPEAEQAKSEESTRVLSQAEADRLVQVARTQPHRVLSCEGKSVPKLPPSPFITSSLQQVAGTLLGLSPERTMAVAQKLYEGVTLPDGQTKGVITYMRTDSTALAPEFQTAVQSYLKAHDPPNLPTKTTAHKAKAHAQEAHEAIRPTEVTLTPAVLRSALSQEEHGLYDLIWRRAVASLCAPARLRKVVIRTQSAQVQWESRGSTVEFPGYTRYWNDLAKELLLPTLTPGQVLTLKTAGSEKKRTQPLPRYSEPKLVAEMEKVGIGRPSTYASTVKTLKERTYVVLQGKVLEPTPLGLQVDEALAAHLPLFTNIETTARMETDLDRIAQGAQPWEKFLTGWNRTQFQPMLDVACKQAPPAQSQGETSDQPCPACGQLLTKIPNAKCTGGAFLKCEKCPDTVMFWSSRTNQWESPTSRTKDPELPGPKQTAHPCPICKSKSKLEQYFYRKEGIVRSLLRCSTKAKQPDHEEAVYFQAKDAPARFWSRKWGELDLESAPISTIKGTMTRKKTNPPSSPPPQALRPQRNAPPAKD
ncbi:type I DNA topoisomerase [Candidatus Cyanaurora vandensis]|uniref:type I DNA topoisomerase n=1 Tax=Candidatus Cyanaurora vandensis TaxID=2714958 RepID=UPI00257E34AA|nr:type I DNA topoisomerase [Candidatus Cyanaurora vandensis]